MPNAIPDGYHSITPYLIVKGGSAAIDFYKNAFGAKELFRMPGPNDSIGHAEIMVGNSPIMLADENPDMGTLSPQSVGGNPVSLLLYVENSDEVFAQAVAAGGTAKRPVQDQFYGDRSGLIEDPFGHVWTVSTHVEDVSPEEIDRRLEAMKSGAGAG